MAVSWRPSKGRQPSIPAANSREDAGDRAFKARSQAPCSPGWEPGILNGEGDKPKWMRWRTFERLATKHDNLWGSPSPGPEA
jgi:hypothetical protein